ncbi:MAG: 1-deoxy-D-xylulose-5-phosphate synthase [Clostridia bacterium]|nr:1-deoxy-D-xylulose-5-phosphate synthase [Clostridia bacterium]
MLEKVNNITDLKRLSVQELPALCQDIRDYMIPIVMNNGGHLASNLGVVELTVALLYVFDEQDKIVFDVGHQSYIYKILTGRKDVFKSLRTMGGISGFCDRGESNCDYFGTGHASTAISACMGMAKARDIQGLNYNCVAVVGDGALTGGMSFEALNNINGEKMLIIVNDNNMSINKSIGNITGGMSQFRIGKYSRNKEKTKQFLLKIPVIGKPLVDVCRFFKRILKFGIINNNLYFNSFNIKYTALKHGNDVLKLVKYLDKIKNNVDCTTVFHIKTTKGYGYLPAQTEPQFYHGIAPHEDTATHISMSRVVGQTLTKLADSDNRIVALTAAMTDGTGLDCFSRAHPNKFFDVGIAEQHAVTFAAGLATQGLKPFVCIYSTFLQRAFDQILHDVCLQNLPVTFCIDRAGVVGEDGKTHQGVFDLSYLSLMPNMTILAPADSTQLAQMIEWSAGRDMGPIAMRYSKDIIAEYGLDFASCQWNRVIDNNSYTTILAVGNRMLDTAVAVANRLSGQGIKVNVINACVIKPFNHSQLALLNSSRVITLEENVLVGGFGSMVSNYYTNSNTKVLNLCVPDIILPHATVSQQLKVCHLDCQSVFNEILDFIIKN